MKRFLLITIALGLTASAAMADTDARPRGWEGALEMYGCQPEAYFLNSSGQLNNPTCKSVGSSGQIGFPEEEEPPEEEPEEPTDPCACLPPETDSALL